ncbi:ABC transporter substrate-binding protein [Streptomyces sp. NPDC049879]|uniref:ABC transporter substrate-binding protein n=1 Tax=Streptomyces sp. NPDC049879 TaxID=3365598 RepID=UPI0037BD4C0D
MRTPARRPALVSLLAAAALSTALAGCSSSGSSGDDPATAGSPGTADSRVVTTDQGEVTVPGDPQRVVVLNYALTGYLYDLGVPVVATVAEDTEHDGEFSEFWGDAPEEQGTGFLPWSMDGFDHEAILGAEPDLIVAGGVGLPAVLAAEEYDRLSRIAPTVLVGDGLTTWQDQFSFLAEDVFDRPEVYEDSLAAYDARVAEVRDAITLPPTPVATLTITADRTPYLLFEDMGLSQTLAELGLEPAPLVAEHGLPPYKPGGDMAELSTEQVGQLLPDVPTVFVTGFNADTADVASLADEPVYAALPAFEEQHAYDLPYWAVRGDYDESLALLDIVEQQFS